MDHLYSSVVRVERPVTTNVDGRARSSWSVVSGGSAVRCRLDLHFVSPGDIQPVLTAGKAPDRTGRMYCASTAPIRAGDRIVAVSGPVQGTFEIRTIADSAIGFAAAHHIEVQIWETNRDLDGLWPGE